MISEYEKQADEFMKKYGVTMETKLLGNMPYFDDDKENRDVYQITLKRGNKTWSFRFGQSIVNSKSEKVYYLDQIKKIHNWNIKDFIYIGNSQYKKKPIAPTPYDILATITKSDPGTFADFCGDFGYDEDSRKAEKTYFAVQKEYQEVSKMFGDCMDELQEIN